MLKKLLTFVASAFIIAPIAVNAEGYTASIPVSIEGTDTAKITIASDDEAAMQAVDGDTKIEIKEGESYAFPISYSEPVSYTYTLTQVAGSETDVAYDSNTYTAHVFVESEDDGTLTPHVVVWKTDETTKSDGAHFTNVKKSTDKKSNTSADTSDNSNALLYGCGIAIGVVAGVIVFVIRKKSEKN